MDLCVSILTQLAYNIDLFKPFTTSTNPLKDEKPSVVKNKFEEPSVVPSYIFVSQKYCIIPEVCPEMSHIVFRPWRL
jgi:hypothetical protein